MSGFLSKKQMRIMLTILSSKKKPDKDLKKSKKLSDMLTAENLNKNIIRHGDVSDVVYELSHGDALKLVGNGTFRIIRDGVNGMENDSIKDIKFGTHTLHIRKHANDIYSGRIDDGLKTIHQFVNRSIPTLTAELMSVFEWYSEDDMVIEEDDKLKDETIHDGISKLVDSYKKNNISDIYSEIENIREEMRNGSAVDIQQAEQKIMKLFDKLEEVVKNVQLKHNDLANRAGDDIDELERKLRELQTKVDSMNDSKKVSSVKAITSDNVNPNKVHDEFYGYLSKPKVTIEPNGRITIGFESDWEKMDKVNFLSDMKAKVVAKK